MLDRIRRHGKNQCGIEFMRHLWLHLSCGFMVGDLSVTLNKEFVMVHCGDLELWLEEAH